MKAINFKGLDQDEMRTLLARLNLHAAQLRGILAANEGEALQPPKLSGNVEDCFQDIGALTIHVTELEHRIGANCPQFVSAAHSGGNSAPGRASAGSSHSGPAHKQNLTEKIMTARGVKTLAELANLPVPLD